MNYINIIMDISNNVFSYILYEQIKNKYKYNNNTCLHEIISIVINNNKIKEILDGKGYIHPMRKLQYIKLIENVLKKYHLKNGIININLSDHPKTGVFNFCRNINDNNTFLLPDFRFTHDDIKLSNEWVDGKYNDFNETTIYLQSLHNEYKFENKINKLYTSCIPHISKLPYFVYALNNLNKCAGNMYGGSVHKYNNVNHDLICRLEKHNLASKNFIPFIEHFKYKYIIYNDGNTLSNRMKLLLNVNSVIIKQKSPYEEIYSYLMKNNIHFIEYSNVYELSDIYDNLENNSSLCKNIIENNKQFVMNTLNYENILKYTVTLLNNII